MSNHSKTYTFHGLKLSPPRTFNTDTVELDDFATVNLNGIEEGNDYTYNPYSGVCISKNKTWYNKFLGLFTKKNLCKVLKWFMYYRLIILLISVVIGVYSTSIYVYHIDHSTKSNCKGNTNHNVL
jgi:hypothetical protein